MPQLLEMTGEQIEDIYQDGFLNISDLNAMPAKLAKLLLKYIR